MRSRRAKRRLLHPTRIRRWVLPLTEEQIYTELLRRRRILERGIRPHFRRLADLASQLLAIRFRPMIGAAFEPDPPFVELMVWCTVSRGVAAYWAAQPYQRHRFLPRIEIHGRPWDVTTGAIHVLDLEPWAIRRALRWFFGGVRSWPRQVTVVDDEAQQRAALSEIAATGRRAWMNPLLQHYMATLVIAAGKGPHTERRVALRRFDQLVHAVVSAGRRELSTRADQHAALLRDYERRHMVARGLAKELRTGRPPSDRRLRAAAQAQLEPTITGAELARVSRAPGAVALRILSRRSGFRRPDEILRLARKADAVAEEWGGFQAFFERLSRSDQDRLFPALPWPAFVIGGEAIAAGPAPLTGPPRPAGPGGLEGGAPC